MVTVAALVPFARLGSVTSIVEFSEDGAPAVNSTVSPVFTTGEVRLSIFDSAFVDRRVQVAIPEVLVEVHRS